MGTLVHDESDCELVPASDRLPTTHYRLFFGTVHWNGSDAKSKKSYAIFLQESDTKDWQKAKNEKQIFFTRPPHILEKDLDAVLRAFDVLKARVTPNVKSM